MAQALPIPAGQPLEATRTAAGQVVTLAGAEAVAVQAAGSITVAALLWPLIPAARAMAGLASALGPWLPLRPLPEQQVVVMPGSGGAGRGATVPDGAPGAVRAADAITLAQPREALVDALARDARALLGVLEGQEHPHQIGAGQHSGAGGRVQEHELLLYPCCSGSGGAVTGRRWTGSRSMRGGGTRPGGWTSAIRGSCIRCWWICGPGWPGRRGRTGSSR